MFDTLYRNINIASMSATGTPYGAIPDGAIGVLDGRLAYVGAEAGLPDDVAADTVVECDGEWVFPGFIDCHTHAVFGGNRAREHEERLNGVSYEEIARRGGGILSTVNATREASAATLVRETAARLSKLADGGVTTVEIKSGYGLTLKDEIKMLEAARIAGREAGVGVVTTFLGAHALPPEYKGDKDGYIAHVAEEMIPAIAAAELADAVDAFCEGIAFSPEQVARVFEAAAKHDLKVKLHADQLSDLSGGALAAKYGALSADHLEYASAESIRAMKKAGTVAVLLPGAFYMLRERRRPPVEMLRSEGVPMALATDMNPGTSPVLSIQLMLHMGCTLFGMTPEEAVHGVTANAAAALGLAHDRGTLESGKRADLVFFDIKEPAELAYWVGGVMPSRVVRAG